MPWKKKTKKEENIRKKEIATKRKEENIRKKGATKQKEENIRRKEAATKFIIRLN